MMIDEYCDYIFIYVTLCLWSLLCYDLWVAAKREIMRYSHRESERPRGSEPQREEFDVVQDMNILCNGYSRLVKGSYILSLAVLCL